MLGGIYSDQKCPICDGAFVDNHRDGLTCPKHPKMRASRHSAKFGKLFKRFKEYDQAQRFLTGVRFKTDEKTYDVRDYKKDNPLGFTNMSNKWMGYHLDTVRPGSRKNIKSHLRHAQNFFLNRSVKDLRYGDFEDFIQTLTLSDKTKHNIMSTVHHFYTWMKRRQEIAILPDFPVISFELGYRRTVDKGTQAAIIEEVKQICGNQRVYLGIKWLATYISIRPGEMIKLKERDIDTGNGYLYFPHPKERKFKSVPILPEDVDILKSFTMSFPAMPFISGG
jgi:integrase